MSTKKLFTGVLFSAVVFLGGGAVASAQVATTTATTTVAVAPDLSGLQAQIAQLLQQVAALQAQLAEIRKSNTGLQNDVQQIKQTIQLSTRLHPGMSGEDVKRLQEILATDPNIYSKDKVTGYYGPLTEEAVKHFQKHFGLEQAGVVGPMTLEKINELLKEHNATSTQDLSENDLGDLGDANDMMEGDNNHGDGMMSSTTPNSGHGEDGMSSTTKQSESEGHGHGGE
ncbi:MAG: peptidoglycan-binding domain-containing protein [Minisyncoccota bacterium]